MNPNTYLAYLSVALTAGGNETVVSVDRLTTLTGETIQTSDFATFGRAVITVNPDGDGVSSSPEFISATAISQSTLQFTGCVRNLSAKGNTQLTTPSQYFPTATPVVISWGYHQISDLITYINDTISGGFSNASITTSGVLFATAPATGRNRAMTALVQQNTSPNLYLIVNGFSLEDQNYAGATTTSSTPATCATNGAVTMLGNANGAGGITPVLNPRIDLLVYSSVSSQLIYRIGQESSSPVVPAPSTGDIVLASIYNTVGEASIKDTSDGSDGYIYSWYYPAVFSGGVPSGSFLESGSRSTPSGYLPADGSAISRSAYANLLAAIAPSQTATISNASPAVVTAAAHNLVVGDLVHFTTTGSLPSGLATGVGYYVISAGLTTGAFQLALSPAGSAINTTTAGNGVHTLYKSPYGIGDGSTTFNVPDRRSVGSIGIGNTNTGNPPAISLAFDPTTVGTNTIAVPDISFPAQGQIVKLKGNLPTGLTAGTSYYVIRNSATSISLASSQANANAGTPVPITFTSSGMTGVCYIVYALTQRTVLGKTIGEETHGQANSEIANHNHLLSPSNLMFLVNSGAYSEYYISQGGTSGSNIGQTIPIIGLSSPADSQHNIFTPTIQSYFYIKT